jgi:hypothetical protein
MNLYDACVTIAFVVYILVCALLLYNYNADGGGRE